MEGALDVLLLEATYTKVEIHGPCTMNDGGEIFQKVGKDQIIKAKVRPAEVGRKAYYLVADGALWGYAQLSTGQCGEDTVMCGLW